MLEEKLGEGEGGSDGVGPMTFFLATCKDGVSRLILGVMDVVKNNQEKHSST